MSGVATAQSTSVEQASSVVETMMQAAPIPAVSIAVYRGDDLAWSQAFGDAHVELEVAPVLITAFASAASPS